MALYSDLNSLKAAIKREMNRALYLSSKEMKSTMQKEVDAYYNSGYPKMYERTNQLRSTPSVSPITESGDTMSFDAYLNTALPNYPHITYTYYDGSQTTSKSPTMTDVLNLTNYGTTSSSVGYLHPAAGTYRNYWEHSKDQFREILTNNMKKFFL